LILITASRKITKLSWSHITELLVLSNSNEINYYISIVNNRNIGYRELNKLIKNDDYSRIDSKTKEKIRNKKALQVNDMIKNPIYISNSSNYEDISEKIHQRLILEDISSFLEKQKFLVEMLFIIFQYDFKNYNINTIINHNLNVYDYYYSLNLL